MLIRSMSIESINNEVCVGALICYLKQLYNVKYKTEQPLDPNGRGVELVLESMKEKELMEPKLGFIDMQIQVIKAIREIIERVEDYLNECEEQGFLAVASNYVSSSKEV